MPRNVVTLSPRSGVDPEACERILSALERRYRPRRVRTPLGEHIELDFPRRMGLAGKAEVVAELDRIDRGWPDLFEVFPVDPHEPIGSWGDLLKRIFRSE